MSIFPIPFLSFSEISSQNPSDSFILSFFFFFSQTIDTTPTIETENTKATAKMDILQQIAANLTPTQTEGEGEDTNRTKTILTKGHALVTEEGEDLGVITDMTEIGGMEEVIEAVVMGEEAEEVDSEDEGGEGEGGGGEEEGEGEEEEIP